MAQLIPTQTSIDSFERSDSSASLQSNMTFESRRSSLSTLYSTNSHRHGLLNKLGTGVQLIFRRLSRAHKTVSAMEIQILSTITNFTREEILQWHEKFLADCPHGYMTRKQFVSMYKALCPQADVERFARHIFRAFDLDKSNTVDFREFLIGLSMTSTSSLPQTKLEWIFQVFDIDGNGLLTRAECLEVIDVIVRFNHGQQNDEDNFHIDELVSSAKRSMMRIFDNISDSRRHVLTMSQFVQGCQKDQFISQLLAASPGNNHSSSMTLNTYDIPTIEE